MRGEKGTTSLARYGEGLRMTGVSIVSVKLGLRYMVRKRSVRSRGVEVFRRQIAESEMVKQKTEPQPRPIAPFMWSPRAAGGQVMRDTLTRSPRNVTS